MTDFPLQKFVERHGCKYFAENDTGNGDTINLALRSPFIRLYALNREASVIEKQKQRFADNERIQLFTWTHERAWVELVRLVPVEQPSVFWIHPTEVISRCLTTVGQLRPRREDVFIFELGKQRGPISVAERHFRNTHWLAHFPDSWGEFEIMRDWKVYENEGYYILYPRGS